MYLTWSNTPSLNVAQDTLSVQNGKVPFMLSQHGEKTRNVSTQQS